MKCRWQRQIMAPVGDGWTSGKMRFLPSFGGRIIGLRSVKLVMLCVTQPASTAIPCLPTSRQNWSRIQGRAPRLGWILLHFAPNLHCPPVIAHTSLARFGLGGQCKDKHQSLSHPPWCPVYVHPALQKKLFAAHMPHVHLRTCVYIYVCIAC